MAAATAAAPHSVGPGEVPCPDPSVHEKPSKLADQASSAALYVTHPDRGTNPRENMQGPRENVLGPDGNLSSKSAATSLKYAKAHDLPSFPSHGLNTADSAGKAAMLAKDYKMKDLWQPEMSAAGSKAALLAHRDGGKLDLWHPSASAAGNSAATLAMRNKGLSPQLDYGYTPDGRSGALQAATMSIKQGRQRSESNPPVVHPAYPDSSNSAYNAKNAATASHRVSDKLAPDGWDADVNQAARVTHLHMAPEMFGERPPVEIEQAEKRHQAALRASTISMAKQMYEYQNRTAGASESAGSEAAATAHARAASASGPLDTKQEALRYIHLHDAAQKLAQERLAKVGRPSEDERFREYYGYGSNETSPKKSMASRLSIRGRNRPRASSDGDLDDSDDEAQARRIRSQMSQLNSGLDSVDDKKRQDDRANLMAAAEKRVHARMHDMDEKVFSETGKISPAMMEEWEAKARKRAQEQKEEQGQNQGKTHIGGGKYIPQGELEAIAAARLKPTLDEINDTAEKRRAKDEEQRLGKEESERQKRDEKQKHKEEKEEQRRVKLEEKEAAKKDKEEARARKSEDKRKSRETKRDEAGAVAAGATPGEVGDGVKDEEDQEQKDKVATGATLGEVADKVKNEPAEDKVDDAKSKDKKRGGGLFSGIGSRLRRNRKDVEKVPDKTEDSREEVAKPAALVGAAAGGVAVEEAAEKKETDGAKDENEDEHEHKDQHEEEEAKIEVTQPQQPEDEEEEPKIEVTQPQQPEVDSTPPVIESTDATDRTDATGPPALAASPNLERHISAIVDSDDDDDLNADAKLEASRPPMETHGEDKADVAADTVRTSPVSPVAVDAPFPTHEGTNETLPIVPGYSRGGDAAVAEAQPERGDDADDADDAAGPAPQSAGPNESGLANIVDPQGAPDPSELAHRVEEEKVEPAAVRDEGEGTGGPDPSELAQRVEEEKVEPAAARDEGEGTGVIPPTSGPHDSNIANIIDPRVKPDVGELKERTEEKRAAEAAAPASAPSPAVKTGRDDNKLDKIEPGEKEDQKGIRGFFSKLRHRQSKGEPGKLTKSQPKKSSPAVNASNKPTEVKAPTPEPADTLRDETITPVTTTSAGRAAEQQPQPHPHAGQVGTDGPIGDDAHVSGLGGNPDATSPSSFTRDEGELADLNDVSSSGLEKEDLDRGRGERPGGLAGEPGLGGEKDVGTEEGEEEEEEKKKSGGEELDPVNSGVTGSGVIGGEQVEEATDQFDESLAPPPPAFAGQTKAASPVRETKFHEEV